MSKIPTKLDALFAAMGKAVAIPGDFFKSLAWHESSFKEDAKNGASTGIFQITPGALVDYNKANGTSLTIEMMADVVKAGGVAAWHVKRIAAAVAEAMGFKDRTAPDWSNVTFVSLVFLGYTAGWSAMQGVPYIVSKLRLTGTKVDTDAVIEAAGILFPKSRIYVDPKKMQVASQKPGAGLLSAATATIQNAVAGAKLGPYMSDPRLRSHVLAERNDYFELRGSLAKPNDALAKRNDPASDSPKHDLPKMSPNAKWWVAGSLVAVGYLATRK